MISSSAWILFHANALCLIRRLQPVARTNPLLAALAILAPAVVLVGTVWVNAHRATTLAAFLGGEEVTAMVLAAAIVFAIAGFNVQHISSAGRYLDGQIRSAPVSRLDLFLSTVGIPFTVSCLVLSVLSLMFFVPLGYAAGASLHAPVYLVLFEVAIFYAAGAVGEVLRRVMQRQPAALVAMLPLIAAWVGAGISTRSGA